MLFVSLLYDNIPQEENCSFEQLQKLYLKMLKYKLPSFLLILCFVHTFSDSGITWTGWRAEKCRERLTKRADEISRIYCIRNMVFLYKLSIECISTVLKYALVPRYLVSKWCSD